MRLLRPDPRTGIVKVGQRISRPVIPPSRAEELRDLISLTEDIKIIQTDYTPPAIIAAESVTLTQQVEVIKPPKAKKNRSRSNKKLASKVQTG